MRMQLTEEAQTDYKFLIAIGLTQIVSASLRLLLSVFAGIGSSREFALRLKLLSSLAAIMLHYLAGGAILLTCRADSLERFKRRATGCLVTCSLTAVFAVYEFQLQVKKAATMVFGGGAAYYKSFNSTILATNNTSSDTLVQAARQRHLSVQHRLMLASLMVLQCVILAFAAYLCVRIIWSKASGRRLPGERTHPRMTDNGHQEPLPENDRQIDMNEIV